MSKIPKSSPRGHAMRPHLAFPLQFLTKSQVESLHQAILSVLSETGVRVEWRPAWKFTPELAAG